MTNDEVYEKLVKLQWLLHKQQLMGQGTFGEMADISRGQGRVLTVLQNADNISTKDLAYVMGIRQQSLNELLKKLEKKGYVVRKASEQDKRVMNVMLTEEGKKLQQPKVDYTDIFQCLNEEELLKFAEYLDRIINMLEERMDDVDVPDMYDWMMKARERMGNEQFDKLTEMRRNGFGRMWEDKDMFGMSKEDIEKRGFGRFGGFGPDFRGKAPENMPGAERFSPDYDGPMPEGRKKGFNPFGKSSEE